MSAKFQSTPKKGDGQGSNPFSKKESMNHQEKTVKVSLRAPHLKEGGTFYRGTYNGERQATPTNPLLEITKEGQEVELKGEPEAIDALLARLEADDAIVCAEIK